MWRPATMPTTLQIHKLSSKTQTSNVVDIMNLFLLSLGVSPGSSTLQNLFEIPELTKSSTEPSLFHASGWDKTSWAHTNLNTWRFNCFSIRSPRQKPNRIWQCCCETVSRKASEVQLPPCDCHRENKNAGNLWAPSTGHHGARVPR